MKGVRGILIIMFFLIFFAGPLPASEILEELNLFRTAPLEFISLTEKDPEEIKALWPEKLFEDLKKGVPPLVEDEALSAVAQKRAEEILAHGLPLPDDFERDLFEELKAEGLKPLFYRESYVIMAFENPLPEDEIFNILLDSLFKNALEYTTNDATLLFPCWRKVGYALATGEIEIEGIPYHGAALVLVFSIDAKEEGSRLFGMIYKVDDEAPVPLSAALVRINPAFGEGKKETMSFPDGSYCIMDYEADFYELSVSKEGLIRKEVGYLPPKPHRKDFFLFP